MPPRRLMSRKRRFLMINNKLEGDSVHGRGFETVSAAISVAAVPAAAQLERATAMKLILVHHPAVPASVSPYCLLDNDQRQEIDWTNAFLDAQRIRQPSLRSLRAYAYDLLHFARWWLPQGPLPLSQITESTLLDYVRHQLDQQPKPTPQTVNHRLCVVRCLYRFHYGREIPTGEAHLQHLYTKRFSLRYGRPLRVMALGIRLRQ